MTEISRAGNEAAAVANCLFIRGRLAAGDRDVKGALAYALEAQRMAERAGDRSVVDRAAALGQIGYAYSVNEAQDEAQAYFTRSMEMFEQAGRAQSDASVNVRANWGIASLNRGTPLQALALFEEALDIAKRRSPTGEPPAGLVANRATALRVLERFTEAVPAARYASELASRDGDVAEQIYILHANADLARRMGELEQAQRFMDEALARMNRQGGDPPGPESLMKMRHRLYQGQVFAERGRLAEAKEQLDAVIATYDERDCCRGAQSLALAARAEVAVKLGQRDAALADAQRAVGVAKRAQGRAPHSNYTGGGWLAVGQVRRARGESQLAITAFETASTQLAGSLGADHPDVLEARRAIDQLRRPD
jgi:tetratricopeptide (TPR) repeat protein